MLPEYLYEEVVNYVGSRSLGRDLSKEMLKNSAI